MSQTPAERRAALLALRLRGRGLGTTSAPDGGTRLSDSEHRVLDDLRRGRADPGAYNNGLLVRLRGRIDVPRLIGDLRKIVARHEGWRTTFAADASGPRRVVSSESAPIVVERALALEQLARAAAEDESAPFDLEAGPLVRVVVYDLGADEVGLLLVAHHAVCDGWTARLALTELSRLAAGAAPSPAVPYREFVARQHDWLASAEAEAHRRYWRQRLEGLQPLRFPGDPTASAPTRSAMRALRDPGPSPAIVRERGLSEFAVSAAGVFAALAQVTGEDDLVFWTPMANRRTSRDEQVFGCCVNLQPLRLQARRAKAIELLEGAWDASREAVAHQWLCAARHVFPEGAPSTTVFEVVHRGPESVLKLPGVDSVVAVPLPRAAARTDLHIVVDLRDGGSVWAHHRPLVVAPSVVDRLLDALVAELAELGVRGQAPPHPAGER